MIEKISLEEFLKIKKSIKSLIKDYINNENTYDSNLFKNEYYQIQNRLFNYDLSDIPFEEWNGFEIKSDINHIADFSKTKANIDFNLVIYRGYGNFKGCNVRNLDNAQRFLNPNDFDEEVVLDNPSLFLSNNFSDEFKDKYYNRSLNIEDLANLSSNQIEELNQKFFYSHFIDSQNQNYNYELMFETIGLNKAVELYNYSKEEYQIVKDTFGMRKFLPYTFHLNPYYASRKIKFDDPITSNYIEQIKKTDVKDMKELSFDYAKAIFNSNSWNSLEDYPKSFINENKDLFLVDVDIPDEVKKRYLNHDLKIQDIVDYPDIFKNISTDNLMDTENRIIYNYIKDNYGNGKYQELVIKHPDVFKHIEENHDSSLFVEYLNNNKYMDLESAFTKTVNNYFYDNYYYLLEILSTNLDTYEEPNWVSSMNFTYKKYFDNTAELLSQYTDSIYIVDHAQRRLINEFNIENIKKFEQETGFFSSKDAFHEMLWHISQYFLKFKGELNQRGINFKHGSLSYSEFLDEFAKVLDNMRENNKFRELPNYDWLEGEFRDNHPEIFMDVNAPKSLKSAFYRNEITPKFLYEHNDDNYFKYLVDRNFSNLINAEINLNYIPTGMNNFIEQYISRYGKEKLLNLLSKYGDVLSEITILDSNNILDDEQAIEKSIRNAIYKKIIDDEFGKYDFSYLLNVPDFVSEYPEIFFDFDSLTDINETERNRLKKEYYTKKFSFENIYKYPQLKTLLKDKNLEIPFGGKYIHNLEDHNDFELCQVFGNEKFLELCSTYGGYMERFGIYLRMDCTIENNSYIDTLNNEVLSFEDIKKRLEQVIVKEILSGNIEYYDYNVPSFLKEQHPELFLDEDAPLELKICFYNYPGSVPLSFGALQIHKDWLPYLENKDLPTSLIRNKEHKYYIQKFIQLFGKEKAIELGIDKAETVEEMIKIHDVELMKKWYDKTGGRFIPDFVVMQNFKLEEADKFLKSGYNWSNLMKIYNFSNHHEPRDAMLKIAYSFGAFDQDQRGFKKVQELLTSLPKKIDAGNNNIFEVLADKIEESKKKNEIYDSNGDIIKDIKITDFFLESLEKENVNIDLSKPILEQLYIKKEDNSYSLNINQQSYPKTSYFLRLLLEKYVELPILTPAKAHKLFGGFELKYDPDFREFLLKNLDTILKNSEYSRYVSSIQRQFSEIKIVNSNRTLTLEHAVSYVQENRYENVNVGNETVAEISAVVGYSQKDFNMLQKIFNYGKQRTFSSIPRIKKTIGKYTYEMLRLSDSLAMAVGPLSDCCQSLYDVAETCMEHSMIDKNGRAFIVRDEDGNIAAQSWVWRNKDVLCFDNIEIPDKAFTRVSKDFSERKNFADEIYDVYKEAAHDLIKEDEKVFNELLEENKIDEEQYDGLRLGKITVGLGYNDIASTITRKSKIDDEKLAEPLPYKGVVVSRGLYTNDSNTQYVLDKRNDRKEYDGDTLSVHSDDYIEYDDSNFTEISLLSLNKLEIITKDNPSYLETFISDATENRNIVSELADNYGLHREKTKIIMNPNFAIIYEVNDDEVRIGDLLFNTIVDNGDQQMDIEYAVILQMRLALNQISNGKKFDISSLDEKQINMYKKVMDITYEIDRERGVGLAK